MHEAALRGDWPSADARARGLGARLLRRSELEAFAGLDVRALADALARTGRFEPVSHPPSAASVEAAARRTAAAHLRLLARWGGGAALDVVHAEHDRRIVRAMLRGAATGAPAEARLAGLVPTPLLPERALAALAREPTAARVAAHLVVLGYPGATELVALASRAQPVAFEIDLALLHAYATRAIASARRGDRNLRDVVAWQLDTANVVTALALAAGPRDTTPEACFVDGGAIVSRDAFVRACTEPLPACVDELLSALAKTPLALALRASGGDAARFERASLAALATDQRRRARLDPLSSAPFVSFLLHLDAQSADVRRLAWSAALGAPAALVRGELVTPWS